MISRTEMENALINRFKADLLGRIKGYEKKVKTQVDAALEAEYNTIILGKKVKDKPVKKEDKKFNL